MDNRMRLGLVGLNFGAALAEREILSGPGKDYVQAVAACDLDPAKAKEFAQRFNLKACGSLEEMLADSSIEAIGLFTPPSGRAGLLRSRVRAGKHVIATKPFELDPSAALDALREARRAGVAAHLNSPGPLPAADAAKIQEWSEAYELGQPVAARWETYARYHETADGSWMDSPERCPAAPIFRLGIYGINELIELMGPVESVQVSKSRIFTGRPTPDNAELSMKFANGALGSVFASLCVGDGMPYPASLLIHYENGTVAKRQLKRGGPERNARCDAVELVLNCVCNGKFVEERCELPPESRSGAYQWKNFYDAARNGGSLPGEAAPETVAAGIAVIAAMSKAERSGMVEKVDLR